MAEEADARANRRGDPAQAKAGPKPDPLKYKASRNIKQLRRRAMEARRTPEAIVLEANVEGKEKEQEAWQRMVLEEVLKNNWNALCAVRRAKKVGAWTGKLTQPEDWKQQLQLEQRFRCIFHRQNEAQVRADGGKSGRSLSCSASKQTGSPSPRKSKSGKQERAQDLTEWALKR